MIELSTFLQYCWNAGGHLSEFDSLDEEKALDSILASDSNFWIGLSDFAHEGTWRWQESHQEPSYTNWNEGEPNNKDGDEDCVNKTWNGNEFKWNDVNCSVDDAHALCQMEK